MIPFRYEMLIQQGISLTSEELIHIRVFRGKKKKKNVNIFNRKHQDIQASFVKDSN